MTMVDVDSTIHSLELYFSTSDWLGAYSVIRALSDGLVSSTIELSDDQLQSLLRIVATLSSTVAPVEVNTATVLNQISIILDSLVPQTKEQANWILASVHSLLLNSASRFGTTTEASLEASRRLLDIVAQILGTHTIKNLEEGDEDILALLAEHSAQLVNSLVSGEADFVEARDGLLVTVALVPTNFDTTHTTTFENDLTTVTLQPSQFFTEVDGDDIGISVVTFNGTFPSDTGLNGITTVVDVSFTSPSTEEGGDGNNPRSGSYSVRFKDVLLTSNVSVEVLSYASCQVYDTSSQTWVSACTSSQPSPGTVDCTCGSSVKGPLTVVFGSVATPGTLRNGMSTGALAAAIAVPIVVVVAAAIFGIYMYQRSQMVKRSHARKTGNQIKMATINK